VINVPTESQAPALRFSFWSFLNRTYFSPEEWDQLNDHHALIIAYEWMYPYPGFSEGIPGSYQNITRNDTIETIQYLRDNYPQIEIMFPIFGGYLEAEHYLTELKKYLETIKTENLTNVIGFNYDLERHNDTCWHDKNLLERARTNLQESIRLIREFNSSYRIDNTGGIWMMFDNLPLGGNFELYKQHALMSVTGWDHYAWQLYRGNAVDPASDLDSSDITERMMSSVAYLGENHTIPLFGMNGVGDYGPNNCAQGTCNFQGIIKDCQIARGLGVREVQFYTLCTAGIYQNVYYPSMFEAYGSKFLDVLNASVNGLNVTKSISVPGNYVLKGTVGYWWEDVVISISLTVIIAIASLSGVLTAFILKTKKKLFTEQ